MTTLFSKVDTARLIGRDYLYAGLANIIAGDAAKGAEYLKVAETKQTEDENYDEEISETAFEYFKNGENEIAAKIFTIPASNDSSDYFYDSNFYLGQIEYGIGSKLVTVPEGTELTPEEVAAKMTEAKPHLEAAVKSLGIVGDATKKEVVDKYKIPALYYKGLTELALDNVMYDPENAKGIFVDSFTKLLAAISASGKAEEEANKTYAADAHNYIGYFAYLKGDNAKAKAEFAETLKLKPEDPFATQMVEAVK
jgi:tetratricopeptide (TPR) repeat protein